MMIDNHNQYASDSTSASSREGEQVNRGQIAKEKDERITLSNFTIGRVIGEGGWGCVRFAKHKHTGATYAVKAMSKYSLLKEKQADHAKSEKEILEDVDHPFLVKLKAFEQDSKCIYFIQEFIRGGEFLTLLKQKRRLELDITRFYASQILLALEYLHSNNIIYRDLKPENILVDKAGYLKIVDFGLSKKIYGKTYTVCGTPHYIAPEVLLGQGYGTAADWYTFGVLLYEMLVGFPPFKGDTTNDLFMSIVNDKVRFPSDMDHNTRKLLKSLLNKDPSKRITSKANGVELLKKNRFFRGIDFDAIYDKACEPPFFPSVEDDDDTSNFREIKKAMLNSSNCPDLAFEDDIFQGW